MNLVPNLVLSSTLAGVGLAAILIASVTAQADEVLVTDSQGKELRRKGTVVDVKGDALTIRLLSGREAKISLERVTSIDADWSRTHQAADREYALRRYSTAVDLYRKSVQRREASLGKTPVAEPRRVVLPK